MEDGERTSDGLNLNEPVSRLRLLTIAMSEINSCFRDQPNIHVINKMSFS